MINQITQAIPIALQSLQSRSTRINYARWMNHFAEWHTETAPDQVLTYSLITSYMASLEEAFNPSSRAQALAAIKTLCTTIHKQDRADLDLYTVTVIQAIKPGRYKPGLQGKMIPAEDIGRLLDACRRDTKPAGLRDASIIALLHSTGMRRAECANLVLDDYAQAEAKVTIRETKNKQDRIAYLTQGAAYHLSNWLSSRPPAPGPIYWRAKRGGDLWPGKGMSGAAIYNIVRRRCTEAGIESYTPHDFRRTLISNLLDQQIDISLVSKIVGHSSAAMTAKYDRRDDDRMKRAIGKIYTPYE